MTRELRSSKKSALAYAIGIAALACVLLPQGIVPAQANFFFKILKEAGEAGSDAGKVAGSAGSKIARTGISGLDDAATVIAKLPNTHKAVAVAAHVTPEGHWKFINKKGEVYTAGTPDELARFTDAIAPEAAAGTRPLSLYLSDDVVFRQRVHLADLPKNAELHLVFGKKSYPMVRGVGASGKTLAARVRPNILVEIEQRGLFKELIWQMDRPLNKVDMRVVSLKPGGAARIADFPAVAPGGKNALVDQINPDKLAGSLRNIPGQTVMVSGRVDGNLLVFKPASGGERTLALDKLKEAATAADVNLVVLHSPGARQPGGRNWFWQKVKVKGLEEAMQRANYADFLDEIASRSGQMVVGGRELAGGRLAIRARPLKTPGPILKPIADKVGGWFSTAVSTVTGEVVSIAVDIYAMDEQRQKERDGRLISWLPREHHEAYFGFIIAGLLGFGFASSWWSRIWPKEERSEYSGSIGYYAARLVRGFVFFLVFLPIVGLPAMFAMLLQKLFNILMAPFRYVRRWREGSATGA